MIRKWVSVLISEGSYKYVWGQKVYKCKKIFIKTFMDIGTAVPKIRQTRTVYMQQDRGWWHTTVIPCITPFIGMELHIVLLLYAMIPCLAAYMQSLWFLVWEGSYIHNCVGLGSGTREFYAKIKVSEFIDFEVDRLKKMMMMMKNKSAV